MARILEEEAIKVLRTYFEATLPAKLAEIEAQYPDVLLPMYFKIDEEYMDPNDAYRFPYASIFVDKSKDETKDRALDQNECTIRVLSMFTGKNSTKQCYRYNAAIREVIQANRTLNECNYRAKVLERIYYNPIMKGNQEVRVAETYLEVTMEVQRR
jgi:hypothetical protein